jgi:hypothetical protein
MIREIESEGEGRREVHILHWCSLLRIKGEVESGQ